MQNRDEVSVVEVLVLKQSQGVFWNVSISSQVRAGLGLVS